MSLLASLLVSGWGKSEKRANPVRDNRPPIKVEGRIAPFSGLLARSGCERIKIDGEMPDQWIAKRIRIFLQRIPLAKDPPKARRNCSAMIRVVERHRQEPRVKVQQRVLGWH
jgi:hypothetical protein